MATIRIKRGDFEWARSFFDRYEASLNRVDYGEVLAGRCELVAAEERWDEAATVLETTRAHATKAELLALPAFADRLDGRAALAAGDAARGGELLVRARDTFAALEATWEAACTDLSLASAVLAAHRPEEARALVTRALEVFDRLRSVEEQATAREILNRLS